jgi:SAM-dependent methyltransferase
MDRRAIMLGDLDLSRSRGLEIGPRQAPMVSKAEGPVLYVDYATTEELRAAQFDSSIDPATICEVDNVWGGRPLAQAEGAPFDYVVASHVIEHVPDLIGWLAELRAALKPGGVVGLAIPDRRFTFDRPRRESGLGEMVEAYLTEARRPSIAQVFDACAGATPVDAAAAWRGEPWGDPGAPLAQAPNALALARNLLEAPRYMDAHVWVFTPASFLQTIRTLAAMDLFPFTVEAFNPTPPGWGEFHVRLKAARRGDRAAIDRSIAAAQAAPVPEPPDLAALAAAREKAALQDERDVLAGSLAATQDELAAQVREAAALRAEREALLASRSWRLTAPLRALGARRKG